MHNREDQDSGYARARGVVIPSIAAPIDRLRRGTGRAEEPGSNCILDRTHGGFSAGEADVPERRSRDPGGVVVMREAARQIYRAEGNARGSGDDECVSK